MKMENKMNKRIMMTLILSFMLSGCAQLGGTYFKKSYVSIKNADTKETEGTLFIWEADTSAAVLFKGGGACMQTALAVKTANIEAQTKLSDAILNLSSAALQATSATDQTTDKESLLEVTGSIKEAAQSLTTTTERTAFLNVGLFYICQIAANDSLPKSEVKEVVKTLIESTSGMESYNKQLNKVSGASAPAPVN